MYTTCPKCRYTRQPSDTSLNDVCPRCGLVFSKWMKAQYRREPFHDEVASVAVAPSLPDRLLEFALQVGQRPNPAVFWGRALLFVGLFLWGWHFIWLEMESNAIGHSFMHNIDLIFHEAGHVIFRLFGTFMMYLGGSLFQVMMPLIVMGSFMFKQGNNFGASVGLWWAGQSMMDIAPYINDARARQMPLLGGGNGMDRPGMHDWYNILGELGMLRSDHTLAAFVDTLGEMAVMLALAWGGYLLYRQFLLLYGRS
jgi:hypothetical protein